MAHNPTTFAGEPGGPEHFDWDDAAALHPRKEGGSLLHDLTAVRRSSFADLIRYVANLPENQRRDYVIERVGDRSYDPHEIVALYRRADFPRIIG